MAKAMTSGNAATTPAGDALAPRRGAAQPPLDLSLGHIGTIDKGNEANFEVQVFGPFFIVVHLETGQGTIHSDPRAFSSRAQRRKAERDFLNFANRNARGTCLSFLMGTPPKGGMGAVAPMETQRGRIDDFRRGLQPLPYALDPARLDEQIGLPAAFANGDDFNPQVEGGHYGKDR